MGIEVSIEHQDKIYLKCLAYLLGKGDVNVTEYQNYLKENYKERWLTVYKDLDLKGFIHAKTEPVDRPTATSQTRVTSYSLTPIGESWLDSLTEKIGEKSSEIDSTNSRTVWTKATGKMTAWILLFTFITLIIVALTLFYTCNPPHKQ